MSDTPPAAAPSTAKYIGVWILASIVGGIAVRIIDSVLASSLIDPANPTGGPYWFLAPIIEYAAWAGVIIAIYSSFKDLLFSKVVPWLIGLGGFGVVITLFTTYTAYSELGLSISPIYAVSCVVSFALAVFAVIRYFKSKQPHRY